MALSVFRGYRAPRARYYRLLGSRRLNDSGLRLLLRNANGDLRKRRRCNGRLRQIGKVNALIELQTNRVGAWQSINADRHVVATRASFAERNKRACMPNMMSLSKVFAERTFR
jgi:hypothetical protein